MADTDVTLLTDLSEFTSTVTDSGDMAWNAGSINGFAGRVDFTIDDTNAIYGVVSGMTTSDEYRYRFYIDEDLTMALNNHFYILWVPDDASPIHRLAIKNDGGTLKLEVDYYTDGFASSNRALISLSGVYEIEGYCKRSTGVSANNGFCKIYFNEDFDTPVYDVTGVDNYDEWATSGGCASFRIGANANLDSGTSGRLSVTRIKMRNTGTQIGGANSDPVLTVPGTQTLSGFGEQAISGVSVADADGPSGLTVRIQASGSSVCTVDLTGTSVDVVNGTNGTNNFQIGTADSVADINTVLDTLTTTLAQVAWTDGDNPPPAGHISATTTITLTAEDGVASDVGTITCNWTMATGNGTKSLLLSESTLSALNTAFQAVEYTPATAFIGTSALYLELTDGNSNTDTATMPIEVSVSATKDVLLGGGGGSVDHRDAYVQIG